MLSHAAVAVIESLNKFGNEAARELLTEMRLAHVHDEDRHLLWLGFECNSSRREMALEELEAKVYASPAASSLAIWAMACDREEPESTVRDWIEQARALDLANNMGRQDLAERWIEQAQRERPDYKITRPPWF